MGGKKRDPHFDRSRRQFATQLAQTAGFLALSLGKGRPARAAQDAVANNDPRFLINIHNRGGSDAQWSHAFMPSADFSKYNNGVLGSAYGERFAQNLAIPHPTDSNYQMGIGMSVFDPSDYANMAIWRGISVDGSHDIGNRIINCGQFSNYAASFSSLISVALAQRSVPLPLHYVQASASPEELYTWPGLLSGYAIAVNIPDQVSFANFTSLLPNEIAPPARRKLMTDAVNAVAQATLSSSFRLKSSKDYYTTFMNSFAAMGAVYGTGMGSSLEFLNTISAYQDAAITALNGLYATYASTVFNNAQPYNNLFSNSGVGTLNSNISSVSGVALNGSLTFNGISSTPMGKNINQAAYCFALADYLITHGMTRVIDIGPAVLNRDGHYGNPEEFVAIAIRLAMLKRLMNRFSSTGVTGTVPGTAGDNYLQHTTIVMTTEFDRTLGVDIEAAGAYPGTNHGASASVIMAGRGVKGGRVFGDTKTAPGANGKYAWASGIQYGWALPVDLNTGQPSSSGTILTTKSIFDTVMAIFGVPVPSQQVTGGVAFPAIRS